MSLIKSISGIRGTIGGAVGENLTSLDILKFSLAYGTFIKKNYPNIKVKIVIGRDARLSGKMISSLVSGALSSLGIDIIDLALASTPTVEMAVASYKAQGGIIITASHNPQGWNALKLLEAPGEFLSKIDGEAVLTLAENNSFESVPEDQLGAYLLDNNFLQEHINDILNLELVDKNLIAAKNFKIIVDGINSVGGVAVPELLRALGVKILLN